MIVPEPRGEPTTEVDILRRQVRKTWTWLEETVGDVTAEQANWWPPGKANSIGATYLHVVINTDVEVNRLLLGREPLVEAQWHGDVGQGVDYDPDRFDRWVGTRQWTGRRCAPMAAPSMSPSSTLCPT